MWLVSRTRERYILERRQSTPSDPDICNPLGRGIAAAMGERRVVLEVQARDGRRLNIETALPGGECTPTTTLKLTLPALALSEAASPAASFLRLNRDPANLLLGYLAPESWLEVEQACRAGRVAVASSGCWADKGVGDGQGKAVYVRQRRALHRVSRSFQVRQHIHLLVFMFSYEFAVELLCPSVLYAERSEEVQ